MPRQSITLKDGRPATYRNRVSERIKSSMIVDRLHKCLLGEIEMSSSQIQAARILLNKVLPDLKAVEVASEASYSGDLKSISNAYLLELLEAGKEFDD